MTGAECGKCGQVHVAYNGGPACAGHRSRQPDQPCANNPVRGMSVCRSHGGAAPQAKAAAERRRARVEAERTLARLLHDADAPPVTNPARALLTLLGRMQAAADALGGMVNDLDGRLDYTDVNQQRRAHVVVELHAGLVSELRRGLADAARLDLEARAVALEESLLRRSADELQVFLMVVLAELGVGPDDPAVAAAVDVAVGELEGGLSLERARRWPVRGRLAALEAGL